MSQVLHPVMNTVKDLAQKANIKHWMYLTWSLKFISFTPLFPLTWETWKKLLLTLIQDCRLNTSHIKKFLRLPLFWEPLLLYNIFSNIALEARLCYFGVSLFPKYKMQKNSVLELLTCKTLYKDWILILSVSTHTTSQGIQSI